MATPGVEPAVGVPCVAPPPPKSHCMAPTQRHIPFQRGVRRRDDAKGCEKSGGRGYAVPVPRNTGGRQPPNSHPHLSLAKRLETMSLPSSKAEGVGGGDTAFGSSLRA